MNQTDTQEFLNVIRAFRDTALLLEKRAESEITRVLLESEDRLDPALIIHVVQEHLSASAATDVMLQCVARANDSAEMSGPERVTRYCQRVLRRGTIEGSAPTLSAVIIADAARRNAATAVLEFIDSMEK